jgi:hypothetical protein
MPGKNQRPEAIYAEKQKVFSISDFNGFLFPYITANWLAACITEIENQFIWSFIEKELWADSGFPYMTGKSVTGIGFPTRHSVRDNNSLRLLRARNSGTRGFLT